MHPAPPSTSQPRRPRSWLIPGLLALFLLWRGSNSMFVWFVDPRPVRQWQAGLTDPDAARIARALDIPPVHEAHVERHRLLIEHVPVGSRLLVLHEYTGVIGYHEVRSYLRLSALLYPLYMRMISTLPAPPPLPAVRHKPTYLLDIRLAKDLGPGSGCTEIARTEDAVLWRQEARGR